MEGGGEEEEKSERISLTTMRFPFPFKRWRSLMKIIQCGRCRKPADLRDEEETKRYIYIRLSK